MGVKDRIRWQRLPVRAMRIDNPREETRFWLGFCVLYFLAAILTGWLIRT